jgi:hypothetical protein
VPLAILAAAMAATACASAETGDGTYHCAPAQYVFIEDVVSDDPDQPARVNWGRAETGGARLTVTVAGGRVSVIDSQLLPAPLDLPVVSRLADFVEAQDARHTFVLSRGTYLWTSVFGHVGAVYAQRGACRPA